MEIAQPGDIAYGIFVWLIGGKEHVPALSGVVPLPPEKVAAVVAEQWLSESETFAIWCYCLLLARRVQGVSEQQLQTLYRALQIPEDFARFWKQLPACESDTVRGIVENPSMELTGAVNAAVTGWFREHPAHPVVLDGLQSILVEHPWDRRTLAALKAVPGVEKVTSAVMDFFVRRETAELMARAVEVTEESLPAIHKVYMKTIETIGMKNPPPLYIDQMGGAMNAFTIGADSPIVVLSTMLATCFSSDELASVLGHELGHVMAGHCRYNQLANALLFHGEQLARYVPVLGQLGFAGIQAAMVTPLMAWSRCSEYTADRIGMLACQNEEAYWRAELKLMGYPWSHYSSLNGRALINQALRYEDKMRDSLIDRIFEFNKTLDLSHPRPVLRALELYKWAREGNMTEILDADPDGRRAMAEQIARDPQQHDFLTSVNKEIIDWAISEFGATRRECGSAIRRMVHQGIPPDGTALAPIMHIELVIQKKGSEITYTLHILLNRQGQPVRASLELPWGGKWEDAPDEIRADFIKNNQDTIARVLYTVTERK